ncbi:unnamed protein product [Heterobilharzia americana]|nr:unnamed protein product [Heterobilharzia americana]
MSSGLYLSYLQPVLLHLPVCRRSVFCLCVHSSLLLCSVFCTLYSVPLVVEHPCTGLSSASPSSSPLSASTYPSRSIPCLLSSSFLILLCRFLST